jgi:hypothetical protein
VKRALTALAFLTLAGCTTTTLVRPADLARLDGYEARQPAAARRDLPGPSGRLVTFRPEASLYLELPDRAVGGRFDSIRVNDGFFEGVTTTGDRVLAPVGRVKEARVAEPAPGKTAAAVIFLGLGILATVAAVPVWLALQPHNQGGAGSAFGVR